jgi:hypothetical protein
MTTLSIEPGVLDITAQQGKTWRIVVSATDSSGDPINFSGYAAEWQLRRSYGTPALITLTDGDGITLSSGSVTIVVDATTTAALDTGSYVHEIELIQPDLERPPFIRGTLTVSPEVVK